MRYKTRFRPIERLGPGGWTRFEPADESAPTMPPVTAELERAMA